MTAIGRLERHASGEVAKRAGRKALVTFLIAAVTMATPSSSHAGWSSDPAANVPVCKAPNVQTGPRMIPQGAGGVYIVWTDFRAGMPVGDSDYYEFGDIYLQRLGAGGAVAPGWPLDGIAVCREAKRQDHPVLAPDGKGGVFVAWVDYRAETNDADVYLQHIAPQGVPAPGWPAAGMALGTRPNFEPRFPCIVPDGAGGVIVVFTDVVYVPSRNYYTSDVFAARIEADGRLAPGWTRGGNALCTTETTEEYLTATSDGSGGALVAWTARGDNLELRQVSVQRVRGDGEIASGWPANGLVLSPSARTWGTPAILADGAGGMFVAWADDRSGIFVAYATAVTADGAIANGWPTGGLLVGGQPTSNQVPCLADAGAGDVYIAWVSGPGGQEDVYLQRLTAQGSIAAGWLAGGVAVCTAPGQQYAVSLATDDHGDALLAWPDQRAGPGDVYAARITAAGERATGWPTDGALVSSAPFTQFLPAIVSDSSGGMVLAWEDDRSGSGFTNTDIYATRIDAAGAIGGVIPGTPESIDFSMFPNPATGWVELTLPADGARWTVEIFDLSGRRIWRRVAPGASNLGWDGRDDAGRRVHAGIYVVHFTDGSRSQSRRLAWVE